jgi:hypothetical protein
VPRIENFESTISAWLKADEASVQKRQLSKVIADVEAIKALIEKTREQLASQAEALAEAQQLAPEVHGQIKAVQEEIGSLSRTISGLLQKVDAQGIQVRDLDKKLSSQSDQALRAASEHMTALRTELRKIDPASKAFVTDTVEEASKQLNKSLEEKIVSSASESESRVTALLAEASARKNSGGSPGGSRYRSALSGIQTSSSGLPKITNELDFANSWSGYLSQAHALAVAPDLLLACHLAFLASSVIVTEHVLAQTWVECLGWQSFALHSAASPTWTSEEDWAPGAEHLFKRENRREPRILLIHNYDAGLPECYLVPSLTIWTLQDASTLPSKLFLIPSGYGQPATPQLLQHATSIPSVESVATFQMVLKEGVKMPPPHRREIPRGVEPKLFSQWLQRPDPIEYDLTPVQKARECPMNARVLTNFSRTKDFVGRYFEESSAIQFAAHHQVLPWVTARYGEHKSAAVSEYMRDSAY